MTEEHRDKSDGARPHMIDDGVLVKRQGDDWIVYVSGNKEDHETFDTEKEALKRADEISDEYQSYVQILNEDGEVHENMRYDDVKKQ